MLHLELMHAFVYILHEVVEVNPGFRRNVRRQRLVKQIHKHRLAASNIAIHIQALREFFGDGQFVRLLPTPEQRTEEGFLGLKIERFDARMDDFWGII